MHQKFAVPVVNNTSVRINGNFIQRIVNRLLLIGVVENLKSENFNRINSGKEQNEPHVYKFSVSVQFHGLPDIG
jgi:hypothetical protein